MTDSKLHFLTSYLESGGIWAGALVGSYLSGRDPAQENPRLISDADARPYHQASPLPPRNLGFGGQVQTRSAALVGVSESEAPPVVTTHHAAVVHQGLSLFSTIFTENVAVIVRDPRDVAVSLTERIEGSLEETIEMMADRERVIPHDNQLAHAVSSWSTHVATWLQYDASPTRFFRYEDLRADTEEELTKLLGFLGVEESVDRERVAAAVARAPFERIQREERSAEDLADHQRVCRRGDVGIWKKELDEETVRAIEGEHGKLMRAAGYEPLLAGDIAAAEAVPSESQPEIDPSGLEEDVSDTGLGAEAATEEPAAPAG